MFKGYRPNQKIRLYVQNNFSHAFIRQIKLNSQQTVLSLDLLL